MLPLIDAAGRNQRTAVDADLYMAGSTVLDPARGKAGPLEAER